jgi:hypothetical protein
MNMKSFIRVPAACARLGIGKTRFYELVTEGRLKLVSVGLNASAAIADPECSPGSLDALIDELIAEGHKPKSVPNAHPGAGARSKKSKVAS